MIGFVQLGQSWPGLACFGFALLFALVWLTLEAFGTVIFAYAVAHALKNRIVYGGVPLSYSHPSNKMPTHLCVSICIRLAWSGITLFLESHGLCWLDLTLFVLCLA